MVRNTLMAIGKAFKKGATKVAKKAAKGVAKKAGKKLSELVVERGLIKFNKYYEKGSQTQHPAWHRQIHQSQ